MKSPILLTLVTMAIGANAAILPQGNYAGLGESEIDGKGSKAYRVETAIDNQDGITSTYHWQTGTTSLALVFNGKQAQFDVLMGGKKIGTGSCSEQRCDYSAKNPTLDLQETLVFTNDQLLRFGTKSAGGAKVVWFERQLK